MGVDRERRSRLVKAMRRHRLDALVCCTASDVLLLTGYWPVMANSLAVLTAEGGCVLVVPEDEGELAGQHTDDPKIGFAPETLTCLEPLFDSLREPLRHALKQVGVRQGCVGIRQQVTEQPSSYVVGSSFHQTLRNLLETVAPEISLEPCDELLESERDAKTPHELRRIDRAVTIAQAGFDRVPEVLAPGLTEMEVAARVQMAFDVTPAAKEVQRSYGSFYCMSGPNSAKAYAAYALTRQRRLEQGDLVMIHANTCADGFWTDITRTFTVGPPDARQQEIHGAIMAARAAGLKSIVPGVPAKQVDHAVRSVMEQRGFGKAFKHATGHGVGFAAANGAGHPRIHPLSPDVLQEGSTFNLEPAAYFEGYGGMRHCDMVAVTAKGARVLTDFGEEGA